MAPLPVFEATGADVLQLRDAHFNIALLEDRASVMFGRWLSAHRLGRLEPLRKIATDEYCEKFRENLAQRIWYRDSTIESVQTRGILPGKDFDQALIEICWDAAVVAHAQSPDSKPLRMIVGRHLLIFKRRRGVSSEIADGFGSAHCPKCGAPETLSPETACTRCGSGVNDGSLTWNLVEMISSASGPAQHYLKLLQEVELDVDAVALGRRTTVPHVTRRLTPKVPPSRTELLAWAVELARADGVVTDAERLAVAELAIRVGVAQPFVDRLWAAPSLQLDAPKERKELELWLADLARISMIDGAVAETESRVLLRLAQRIGISEPEARIMISHARSKLYAEVPIDLRAQWRQGR